MDNARINTSLNAMLKLGKSQVEDAKTNMCIVSALDLLEVMRKQEAAGDKPLIEDLGARERKNPVGTGFDLRVEKIFELKGDSFIGRTLRKTQEPVLIADMARGDKKAVIKPGSYYIMQTQETINMPKQINIDGFGLVTLNAIPYTRTTMQRCGLEVVNLTKVDPNYQGKLNLGIKSLHTVSLTDRLMHREPKITISLGARIASIDFVIATPNVNPYNGQWQNGKTASIVLEEQK